MSIKDKCHHPTRNYFTHYIMCSDVCVSFKFYIKQYRSTVNLDFVTLNSLLGTCTYNGSCSFEINEPQTCIFCLF